MCHIRDAITLKNVNNSVIDEIECFAKLEMPRILSEMNLSNKLGTINYADYFGDIYASNPNSFKFVMGDRIMILELANHVKRIFDANPESGFQYFAPPPTAMSSSHKKCAFECDSNIDIECKPTGPYLLNKLVSTADQNIVREIGGYRYDSELQSFSIVLRLLSGPLAYDTLQKNLSCALPSLPSVNRYIYKTNCRVVEGVLRCDELTQYLEERNLEKVVTLSEDATRIVGRVQYDSFTNQIVGFVTPINKENGLPISFAYPARNVHEIIGHFEKKNQISPLVNVIMAKPVGVHSTPAFCLLLYGTDNKYTAEDVCKRWKDIVQTLKSIGITVLLISSDSDPRYNTAMKQLSQLGKSSRMLCNENWFSCGDWESHVDDEYPIFIQDTPHIATKLRNFFLKTRNVPRMLPFGNYFIEQSHLKKIIVSHSKDLHNLSPMVLDPVDKQNYDSAVRMCDKKVTDLLCNTVDDSNATIKFLQIMRFIIESFMDESLTPLQRVYKIWYSVFIIRFWRAFIKSNKKLSLKNNFLTTNCYTCIELNAHNLVLCIIRLAKHNLPHLFLPTVFNSQHCESLFRQIRSITSTFSTVTNCTIKELCQRISKIQLQSDVMSRIGSNFIFPRLQHPKTREIKVYGLPTLTEIYNEIETSKSDAIRDAIVLGLIHKNKVKQFDFTCQIKPHKKKRNTKRAKAETGSVFVNQITHRVLHLNRINLKNYVYRFDGKNVDENSAYVELYHNHTTNRRMIVKKTSFCWLLRGDNERVSSDRLERVKLGAKKKRRKAILSKHKQ